MSYTIPNLFLESFGLQVKKAYNPQTSNSRADHPTGTYKGIEFIEDEEASKLSYLGTPVLFPITFVGGNYKRFASDGRIEDIRMADFQLPVACVVDFRRPKTIITTPVSGGYGTVKEIFAFNDWELTINGFFLPDPNQAQGLVSPYDQEIETNNWNELVSSIAVESQIFLDRKIESITISDFNVNSLRGQPKIRPFTINATSDEPIELVLS
ncbi:MAG: DUF6046 domain-containing protein [Leeuwenhoekiella sp.]